MAESKILGNSSLCYAFEEYANLSRVIFVARHDEVEVKSKKMAQRGLQHFHMILILLHCNAAWALNAGLIESCLIEATTFMIKRSVVCLRS